MTRDHLAGVTCDGEHSADGCLDVVKSAGGDELRRDVDDVEIFGGEELTSCHVAGEHDDRIAFERPILEQGDETSHGQRGASGGDEAPVVVQEGNEPFKEFHTS